ncbi:MAG: hypothetical protein LBM39_02635 [Candidatus Methanoplasma sp.]|jgi:hypothetical protein|nr:hypothetical protein [Candidatus Methanoplasma sp.]
MKKNDTRKYIYLCASVIMIILLALFVQPNIEDNTHQEENNEILGVVYDIRMSAKGYTFSFEDTEGKNIRCFSYDEPVDNGVYNIKGDMSDDGNMFFINNMQLIYR